MGTESFRNSKIPSGISTRPNPLPDKTSIDIKQPIRMNDIETDINQDEQQQIDRSNDQGNEATATRTLFLRKISLTTLFQKWPHTLTTLLLTIVGWISLFILSMVGWPFISIPHQFNCEKNFLEEPYCYCERLRLPEESAVKQPVNTYSNLAYSLAALFCAWVADTKRYPSQNWWGPNTAAATTPPTTSINLMTSNRYLTMSFCLVVANISYSSGYLHAGWTSWGAKLDAISVLMMLSWLFLSSLIKFGVWIFGPFGLTHSSSVTVVTRVHAALFGLIVAALYGSYFGIGQNWNVQTWLYKSVLGLAFFFEIVRYVYCVFFNSTKNGQGQTTDAAWWLGWTSVLLFGVGYAFQIASKGGSSLCHPNSYFQGHAVWHVLSALALGFYFCFAIRDDVTPLRAVVLHEGQHHGDATAHFDDGKNKIDTENQKNFGTTRTFEDLMDEELSSEEDEEEKE